jgi:GT2 family glycosyltransferase
VRICVVLLSYNGWADTLECLESVFRGDHAELRVVVCDNASPDDSPAKVRAWAEGRLDAWVAPGKPLRALSHPPLPKPIPYAEYDRAQAERGGDPALDPPLVLVNTGGNLGYAGGNNVGLRYAMARGFDCVWLLNNDTVVRPDTLRLMAREIRRDPRVGIVGSTLLYYHDPDTVQAWGGATYNPWLALPRHVGAYRPAAEPVDAAQVERRLAYVTGASMLVSARFLAEVGLMSEEYFLYFEEIDWALRGEGRFRLAYAAESIVYHKEGGSIGASTERKTRLADYHFMRNRILVTRKFKPAALPTVYFALAVGALRRARRGEWDRVRMIAELCWRT